MPPPTALLGSDNPAARCRAVQCNAPITVLCKVHTIIVVGIFLHFKQNSIQFRLVILSNASNLSSCPYVRIALL